MFVVLCVVFACCLLSSLFVVRCLWCVDCDWMFVGCCGLLFVVVCCLSSLLFVVCSMLCVGVCCPLFDFVVRRVSLLGACCLLHVVL